MRTFLLPNLSWVAFLVLLLSASPSLAQTPVFDRPSETTHRQLTWDDFLGTKPSQKRRANLQVGIHLADMRVEAHPKGLEEWLAKPVDPMAFSVVDKSRSNAGRRSRTNRVLAHEQGHFDLAEALARRLTAELKTQVGQGSSAEEAHQDLLRQRDAAFQAIIAEHEALQARYDRETKHSANRASQKTWDATIARMLQEATARLAEGV